MCQTDSLLLWNHALMQQIIRDASCVGSVAEPAAILSLFERYIQAIKIELHSLQI